MAGPDSPLDGSGSPRPLGEMTQVERDAFQLRADRLGAALDAAKGRSASVGGVAAATGSKDDGAMGRAMRISTELIGGVVVGAGLGWLVDRALGTWPAFFIVLFLLGSAAGMVNIVRAGTAMKTGPSNPAAGPSVRDERDGDD